MIAALKKIPLEVLIVLAVLAVNGFAVFTPANSLMNWYSSDDAFYYFKVAQNISEGRGVTFDGIGRANGFHPLWMLVCIPVFALARFDLILPLRVLALISILLHAGSGVLLFRLLRRAVSQPAALLASAIWLFNLQIHYTSVQMGMESSISAFFAILFFHQLAQAEAQQAYGKKDLLALGGLAALVLFSRLDNIFLVFLLGLWIIFRSSPLRVLLPWDMLLAAIGAFSAFYLTMGFFEDLRPYLAAAQTTALLALVLRPLVYYFFGLYGAPGKHTPGRDWLRVLAAGGAASLLVTASALSVHTLGLLPNYPRRALLAEALLGSALAFALRLLYAWLSGTRRLLPEGETSSPLEQLKASLPSWLMDGIHYALPAAIALVLYMAWNKLYFGALSPISGQIKHWWGSIYTAYGRPVGSLAEFLGFPPDVRQSPWALALSLPGSTARLLRPLISGLGIRGSGTQYTIMLVVTLSLIMLLLASRWKENRNAMLKLGILPLAAACLAQIVYYNGSHYVGLRHWYWTNQLLLSVLLAGLLIDTLLAGLSRLKIPQLAISLLCGALSIWLAINNAQALHGMLPLRISPEKEQTYLADIRALEAATEPGALIGSTGGGVTAYFIQGRTVVNLDGLMNTPDYFKRMQSRTAHVYLNQIGLDYIHSNPYIVTESEPFSWIFSERTERIGEVGDGTLFRYIPKP